MTSTTTGTTTPADQSALPARVRVLVIGAGFAGLGAAIKLQEHGERDFLVVERAGDVGGTWRDNSYPGAACDVPSQLYSFSFAPNRSWSRSFSEQPEIQAYLQRVAREADVLDRFRFHTRVEDLAWDEEDRVWRVSTSRGEVVADVVVSGAGGLSEPKLPDIPGIESFEGRIFHSARWDHDYDLEGKRVAVIGTGASSIQIVPAIVDRVASLDVYQRTAPWVMPRHDREYPAPERAALRFVPGLTKVYRTAIYWGREGFVPAFTWQPKIATPAKLAALRNISTGIPDDADLRRRVTPDFEIGCKRILISNGYYPALAREHTTLVTDPIAEVTATGIVDDEGVHREVDAIVVATGFHTTDQPISHHVKGRDGRTLADAWAETGQAAYKGTTAAGFPNYFTLVGPNTGLGHSSMVFMIESQIAYVLDALRTLRAEGIAAVEPTQEAQDAWNADLQHRMGRTVWSTGGCASWYLDEHGRNTTLWPRTTYTFRRLLSRFDLDAYATIPHPTRVLDRQEQPA